MQAPTTIAETTAEPPQRTRPYCLSVLSALAGYASYAVSKGVFLVCALPLAVVLTPFKHFKRRVLQKMVEHYLGFFTRTWLPLLRLYKVEEISGLKSALALGPAIYVANHRSFMDGLFLLGLLPNTGVLIKTRDTRQPTYGFLERHFDLIGIDGSLTALSAAMCRAEALIGRGANLLVFAEGTRAKTGRLQSFNRIAFQLSASRKVPLVPVVVHSRLPFMARVPDSIFPDGLNRFRIRFLDPELPRPDSNADEIRERVHRKMAAELKRLDAGTSWQLA